MAPPPLPGPPPLHSGGGHYHGGNGNSAPFTTRTPSPENGPAGDQVKQLVKRVDDLEKGGSEDGGYGGSEDGKRRGSGSGVGEGSEYGSEGEIELTPEELAAQKEKARKERKAKVLKWRLEFGRKLDGAFYNVVMLLATIFALFAQDLLYLALPKSADGAWGVMTAICFGLFCVDLVLSCIGKPGYFGSLFFFLDLLATVSLLPDIPFIWDPFLESVGGDSESASSGTQSASIARAGRAARGGTRAGRLVRIFKLFNLVKKKGEKDDKAKDELEEPSVVGKKLAELTTRKVIIGVMLMVAILPLLNAETLDSSRIRQFLQVDLIAQRDFQTLTGGTSGSEATWSRYIDGTAGFVEPSPAWYNSSNPDAAVPLGIATSMELNQTITWLLDERSDILYLKLWGRVYKPLPGPDTELTPSLGTAGVVNNISSRHDSLRKVELIKVEANTFVDFSQLYDTGRVRDDPSREVFGKEYYSEAVYDKKSQQQQEAAFNIVLTIFIVLLLAVGAALFSKDANKLMIAPIERMVKVVRKLADNPLAKLDEPEEVEGGDTAQFETSLVEAALRKIGMLLQIGFGEAGAEIIGKNLGSGGSVNPMLPGAHCKAVFGFCDIRNFTDATECLQEDVMVFVNLIANITHLAVKRHGGSPNKNIGDAFLVVYKTSASESDQDHLRVHSTEQVRARDMSNGALRAFLEIIDEIKENEQLIEYSKNPAIQARMPGYEVKMGFGLHYGWAIEGAIGSSLKIDASYLSPHVNLAARLESATKSYGVPLLISGELYNNLTPENKKICRRVDKVTVKGSVEPMVLYTTDLNPPKDDPKFPGLRAYTEFFETGIDAYIEGDWPTAGDKFQECLTMWRDDEPARNLLWYLSRFNFRAPSTWRGFRALEEK